jgi:hypothetical protein
MPGSNTVPPVPATPKQPGFVAAHVSVVVGRPPGVETEPGWTVMFMLAVVVTTPGTST